MTTDPDCCTAALPQLTHADDFLALKLNKVCAGISDRNLLLTIRGILGESPPALCSGSKLYRVMLVGAAASALDARAPGDCETAPGSGIVAVAIRRGLSDA